MTELIQFDQWLFHVINGEWHNAVLDALLPYWREKILWIPFYLFLVAFISWTFRKQAIYFFLAVGLTITIADTVSSKVIKTNVQRLRPCNDPGLKEEVQLLVHCGSGYSFTSSHATNHFALAVFLILTLGSFYQWIFWPLLLWAASVAFAQVYVGVHYPMDVFAGSLLGALIAWIMARIYQRFDQLKLEAQ